MILYFKQAIKKLMRLPLFSSLRTPLTFTHITEKFDVVQRVPVYTRIKSDLFDEIRAGRNSG